jgi:hypothetical protein
MISLPQILLVVVLANYSNVTSNSFSIPTNLKTFSTLNITHSGPKSVSITETHQVAQWAQTCLRSTSVVVVEIDLIIGIVQRLNNAAIVD